MQIKYKRENLGSRTKCGMSLNRERDWNRGAGYWKQTTQL